LIAILFRTFGLIAILWTFGLIAILWTFGLIAILWTFGLIAPKTLSYLVFQSFVFECT
jgi:hypothetical protein